MKVKIKVKHLLLLMLVIPLLAFSITQWIVPSIRVAMAKSTADGPTEENENVLELLESGTLPDYKKKALIEEHFIFSGYAFSYDVQTGPSSTMGPAIPMNATRDTYVKWYVENHNGDEKVYYYAINQLAYSYAKQGDFHEAIALLNTTIDSFDEWDSDYWNLLKTKAEITAQTNVDGALELIDQALESTSLAGLAKLDEAAIQSYKSTLESTTLIEQFNELKVNLLINQGSYKQALETLDNVEAFSVRMGRQQRNLRKWQEGDVLHKVEGHISTAEGEPLPFAKVYLRLENTVNQSINDHDETHVTYTDVEGNFQIGGVPDGYYQLYLGLDIDQMDGYTWANEPDDWTKVKENVTKNITLQPLIKQNGPLNDQEITEKDIVFDWDPVDDAAYYQLGFGIEEDGGSTSTTLPEKFKEDTVTLPTEQLYSLGLVFGGGEDDENRGESLLGFTNPNGEYFWFVNAYTETGDLLTSSNGFRLTRELMGGVPYFQLHERERTDEDRILVEGHIESALEGYKQVLEEDPNNLHALRMAEKITKHYARPDFNQGRKDARPYTEKLAAITNDATYWMDLAGLATMDWDWDAYFDYYNKAEETSNDLSDYQGGQYAIALMKTGRLEQAESVFQKLMASDGTNQYMPEWTALILYQTNDFELAKTVAQDYPLLGWSQRGASWLSVVANLEETVANNKQDQQDYEEGMDLYINGDKKQFHSWLEQLDTGSVKIYFKNLE